MPYVEESSIFPAGCLADRDGCIQFCIQRMGNGAFGHSVIRAYSYLHLDLAGRM